jgi:hypothetical protein
MSSLKLKNMNWGQFIHQVQYAEEEVDNAVSVLGIVEIFLKKSVPNFIAKSDLYRNVSSCCDEDENMKEDLLQKVKECPVYHENDFKYGRESLVFVNEKFSNALRCLEDGDFQSVVQSREMVVYWERVVRFAQRTIELIRDAIDAMDHVLCGDEYMYAKLVDVIMSCIIEYANLCLDELRAIYRMSFSDIKLQL